MYGRRLALWAVLAVVILATLAGCGGGAPKVDWTVKVTGAGEATLTYADLVKMPQTELKDLLMQKSRGEDEVHSFVGVALTDIWAKAGVSDPVMVTAVAADGYAVEISREELEGGMIALKSDGEWIATVDKEHGPIRLVFPNTPANRWVFQVQELQVQ